MTLHEILRHKGSAVYSITPDASLEDVVQALVRHNCGSLLVCEPRGRGPGRLVGIVTERDILRSCAAHRSLAETRVSEAMTRDVITATPGDLVEEVMGLMTTNRIRHLPVVADDNLLGVVSIGDIVKAQHDQLTMENHYLKSYLHG